MLKGFLKLGFVGEKKREGKQRKSLFTKLKESWTFSVLPYDNSWHLKGWCHHGSQNRLPLTITERMVKKLMYICVSFAVSHTGKNNNSNNKFF